MVLKINECMFLVMQNLGVKCISNHSGHTVLIKQKKYILWVVLPTCNTLTLTVVVL